ncbi:MAG: TonB-dependent receptor [Bacteroidetes bacterium]|nr:TonB-dependent receptor [Bacteroidota bacterium]
MKKKLIILILLLNCIFTLHAQHEIYGTVTDQDNQTLPGAVIYIPDMNKASVTDKDGKFSIDNLPNGKIKIQFSYLGFENAIKIVILNGKSLELNVKLKQTTIEADEIVISGGYSSTQHDNAVKIDVMKLKDITAVVTPNLCEKLATIPGVDMISKGSGDAKPVIRGLSMNDVLILNNGVRFENYQYSDHHPLGIDEFGLENVDVIKGPASLLYGSDAIGGAINFVKEKPAAVGKIMGDYNLELFSNSLGATNSLGVKGSFKKFFGGLRFGNKTYADYLQGGGSFVPNTRFFGNSFKANAGMNTKNMSLNLYYDYSMYKVGLAETDAIDYVKEHGRGRNPDVYYMLLNTNLLSTRNKIYLNKYKLEINAAYQNSGLIHSEGLHDIAIDMQLQTLTYECRLFLPSENKSEYIIGMQGMNQLNTNLHNRETILLPDAGINNYAVFGMIQYTFFEKLKVQSGLRYDYKLISTKSVDSTTVSLYRPAINDNYGSLSGSLGATYNLNEKNLFRFNFASAYRTPNLAELTSNGLHESRYELGAPNLIPENAYETDVSYHYHGENITFEIAGFYNIINKFIYLSPTNDSTTSRNKIYQYTQSDAFLYGFESGFHIHHKNLKWLHFETTFANVTGKLQKGGYLPFIPANKFRFELRFEKEKIGILKNPFIRFNTQIALDQNYTAAEEERTAGYTLFDIGTGAEIKAANQMISIVLSVNNLLDTKYVDHLSTLKEVNYFNPGRNITLSLRIPFGIK